MAFINSEQYFQLVEQGAMDLHSAVSGYSCTCGTCGTCGVSTATATAIDGQASSDLSNAIQANALAGNAAPPLVGEAPISLLVFDTNLNDVDQNIDALMNDYSDTDSSYWTTPDLTFSFPDAATDYTYTPSTGVFSGQLSALQMSMVRTSLAGFAGVSNLAFTEMAAGSADGTLRFVEGGTTISTAFGYCPNGLESGGDVWMNSTAYDAPVIGNYAFYTFMHEIGHALGLKHGHETNGPGALASGVDSMEYSIMTYRSYVGHDLTTLPYYTNGSTSYAQSLMMYDIAAIQRFYGADFTTNGNDSIYTFSLTTGEMLINGVGQGAPAGNKVFRTVWDGAGVDTYDLSNYTTALNIDLTPGGYTNFDTSTSGSFQRAVLNAGFGGSTVYARGNVFNALQYQNDSRSLIENAIGGSGSDIIIGNAADNMLNGGAGNDSLDGGGGNDRIVFDVGDDLANVLGGADIDTLVISGGSAPTSFGLSAHEFERAEHSFATGGGASQRDDYNGDWQRTERYIYEADGHQSNTRFDPTDAQNWAQIDDNFNPGLVYASQFGYYDTGEVLNRWVAQFNLDGNSDYIYNYYDTPTRLDYSNGRFDDGRTFLEDNDQTDTNNSVSSGAGDWSTKYAVNDANGLADYQYDYYDDGTRSYLEHDQNNETTAYRYQYTFYDANGIADYLQGVRDNGDAYFINL